MLRLALWGDSDLVDRKFAKVKAAFSAIPGARLRAEKTTPEGARELPNPSDRVMAGVAHLDLISMAGWAGGEHGGHMDFAPVVPLRGTEVLEFVNTFKPMVEAAGLDYKTDLMAINARSGIYVSGTSFDFRDEQDTRRVYDVVERLLREAGKRGYGSYRAHVNFMDLAAEQFSYNDHAYRRFVEKIKDAVDPAGILSPGKQSIWPAAPRENR